MQLLQELVKMPAIRTDVLKIFPVETMYNLLQPLLQPQDNWKSLIGKPYNLLKVKQNYLNLIKFLFAAI